MSDEKTGAKEAQAGPGRTVTPLRAFLLGAPRFEVAGAPLVFRSRKAEGLLVRLCLDPGGRVSRETAANLFWGDSSEHHARSSLRQTLLILRRTLDSAGFDGLRSDKLTIELDLERVDLDIDEIAAVPTRIPPRLLREKRLSERLVEGGELVGDAFTGWLRVRRQQLHDRIRAALEPAIALRAGQWGRTEEAALALLNLDPTHEPACRAYMIARAAQGDYTAALRAYEDLWNLLDEDFDSTPSGETQDLVVDIKLGRFPEWLRQEQARLSAETATPPAPVARKPDPAPAAGEVRPAGASAASQRPVIILDPILQLQESDEEVRLARVFRHDLISRLVRFREWSVVDGPTEELLRSAVPLYRVAISTLRSGPRLSYSVTVKNSHTNAFVWGQNAEVDVEDLFARQSSLVADIAVSMNISISAERLSSLARLPEASLDHYDRLLMGQRLHYTWRIEDTYRAEEIISALIEENPRFGPAYSSLAQILNSRHIVFPGHRHTPEALERAATLARTALSLDPFDSRAVLCAAWTAALQRRFSAAEEGHRQALQLNDNDPWTALSAAHGLAYAGHGLEAARIAGRQRDSGLLTSPLHWSYYVGIMFLSGNDAQAIDGFRQLDGGYLGVEAWYVAALALTGDTDEAIAQRRLLEARIAERWVHSEPPSRADIARWIANCFPISDPDTWERFRDGLARAGLDLPPDLAP